MGVKICMYKAILNFNLKCKLPIAMIIMKKSKVNDLTLPDMKIYYKVLPIKNSAGLIQDENRQMEQNVEVSKRLMYV